MVGSLSLLLISIIATGALLYVLRIEQRNGQRLFLVVIRRYLDSSIERVSQFVAHVQRIVCTFFIQLWWRYAVHVSLRATLLLMARMYDKLIAYFEYNRQQTKAIRKDRLAWKQSSHLGQINQHKYNTALSEVEKKQRRQKALDGG